MNETNPKTYRRILLKLSGEALQGERGFGLDPKVVGSIAAQVLEVHRSGVEIAIVIGGGNIFRGVKGSTEGMDRTTADYMGMLATVMNCIAMQDALEQAGGEVRVLSAIPMQELCEPYIRRKAMRHLEKGRIVIFAAGTGNPYFTTDTAAALRGMEINAEVLLKATKVDGVYDKDPMAHDDAVKFETIDFHDALTRNLKVMDATALSLAMDNALPICVFKMSEPGALKRVVDGDAVGTLVHAKS